MKSDFIPGVSIVKDMAKQMKMENPSLTHCQCLDSIVSRYGFKSFTGYLYALNPERQKGDGNPIAERNRRQYADN